MERMHGTTIVAVHRDGVTAIAGDGQVTLGDTIVKRGAVKVRTLSDGRILTGFAGAVSDAFTLLDKFEGYLTSAKGNLLKAAVETVKEWRTDRALRNLEAMLIVADERQILTLSGVGDVIAPDEGVAAVGSGGPYAQAAALALLRETDLGAEDIARRSLAIAADIDIYTSGTATVLVTGGPEGAADGELTDDERDDEGEGEDDLAAVGPGDAGRSRRRDEDDEDEEEEDGGSAGREEDDEDDDEDDDDEDDEDADDDEDDDSVVFS